MKILSNYRKRNNAVMEFGRGMVEMLGVLAVIGVLSIVGVAGYLYAMNKYRSNDILNSVNARGEDIWNRYQDKELPYEITEWGDTTQTGYPIEIVTIPDEENSWFQVIVGEVSSKVCKQVLNGPYDSVLAQVNDGNTLQTYTGDVSICNSDVDELEMIFIWALNTETSKTKPDLDELVKPCVTNGDCAACEQCDTKKYRCEINCPDEWPICSHTKNACVQCVINSDCGEEKICNEQTGICEEQVETCADGQFRSKQGACISCEYAGNIEIDKDVKFGRDTYTGEEGCSLCKDFGITRTVESVESKSYCSFACTVGVSFQTQGDGCITCVQKDDFAISNDTESREQCEACPGNKVYKSAVWPYNLMCGKADCESGYYKKYNMAKGYYSGDMTHNYCVPCSDNRNERVAVTNTGSSSYTQNHFIDLCDNCPNTPTQARFYHKPTNEASPWSYVGWCYPVCEQPDNGNSIEICKTEGPTSPNCMRHFQDEATGNCLPCSSNKHVYVGKSGKLYDSCINCGRTVNSDGYCLLSVSTSTCPVGQIKAYGTEKCQPCDQSTWARIKDDATSGCTANCKKNENNEYDLNGTIETRWVVEMSNGKTFCAQKCKGKGIELETSAGVCVSCTASTTEQYHIYIDNGYGVSTQLQELCLGCAGKELIRSKYSCAPENCPAKYVHNRFGGCNSCNQADPIYVKDQNPPEASRYIAECKACGNRLFTQVRNDGYCVLVKNGQTGVCNSVENEGHENYLAGDGVLFRDEKGYCRSCKDSKSYYATQAQCASCGNRRYENKSCQLGLCTSGTAFLNANLTCVKCNEGGEKTEIPVNSTNLCDDCWGKRSMKITEEDGTEKVYCVEDCLGSRWQGIDGKCQNCNAPVGVTEIGSDTKSRQQCTNCNRVAYSITSEGEKSIWYCSEYAEEGTEFIDVGGEAVSCSTPEPIEIMNTDKATQLCEACYREVKLDEENNVPICVL